jgi:hypothetical protein
MGTLLAHANLAAMDVLDGAPAPLVAAQLGEIDRSTQRATLHYQRMRGFSKDS